MSALPARRPSREAALRSIVAGLLGVGLAGCTVATSASGATSSAAVRSSPPALSVAAPAGATVLVTVPQLAPLSSDVASVRSSPARPNDMAPSTRSAVPATPGRSPAPSAEPVTSSVPSPPAPVASAPTPSSASTTAAATTAATTAAATTAAATTAAATTTSAPATLGVKLANCPTCTVLGTHAGVTSTLGAALVATGAGRAALLALRADGSVAGVGNVVYGTTFPTQAAGQLACDSASRCIVIAQQGDGTAIASAYQVSAQGVWSEVTGQPGIASVTAKAQTLTVGGGVGVAVQDEADGTTVWIVYGWEGDGFGVKGCTTSAAPDPDALTMDACLS